MPKFTVDALYHEALKAFVDRLTEDQMKELSRSGAQSVSAISCYVESGRKFDKIMIATHKRGSSKTTSQVRYFVDRSTGDIFGAKSPHAPNMRWYFGNVRDADLWDWRGFHGEPIDPIKAGVVKVGQYGEYKHFQKQLYRTTRKAS